jgi:hypothetical protein
MVVPVEFLGSLLDNRDVLLCDGHLGKQSLGFLETCINADNEFV